MLASKQIHFSLQIPPCYLPNTTFMLASKQLHVCLQTVSYWPPNSFQTPPSSHLPVLIQRDGAVIVCVVHVEQDCGEEEDAAQLAFDFWTTVSFRKKGQKKQQQRKQAIRWGLTLKSRIEEVVIRGMLMLRLRTSRTTGQYSLFGHNCWCCCY